MPSRVHPAATRWEIALIVLLQSTNALKYSDHVTTYDTVRHGDVLFGRAGHDEGSQRNLKFLYGSCNPNDASHIAVANLDHALDGQSSDSDSAVRAPH